VDVKVGQSLDATTGHIQERYQAPPPPVKQKKTAASGQREQQNTLATPAASSGKPNSRISPTEADDEDAAGPAPQTDEQSTISSTEKSPQTQY